MTLPGIEKQSEFTSNWAFPVWAIERAVVWSGRNAADHGEQSSGESSEHVGRHEDRHKILKIEPKLFFLKYL